MPGVENIFTDHGPGSRRGFNIYPAAFDNAGKNSRQESMQEAFRSQVEEQAKLWQEALHGSETMKAQIRQMILYHSLCEAKEASGKQTMSGWYREYEQAGRLPAKDKREGKRILEELRARVL